MEKEQNNFTDLQLYVGLDVHKKQWSVSIYTPSSHHRTFSQPPHPEALKSYLDKHFNGAKIKCAYEAGPKHFLNGLKKSSCLTRIHALLLICC